MTELLEHAVKTVRALSPEVQDDLARVLLQLAGHDQPLAELTPEEHAAVAESEAAAERGEFATDEQVRAIWAKLGLSEFDTPSRQRRAWSASLSIRPKAGRRCRPGFGPRCPCWRSTRMRDSLPAVAAAGVSSFPLP